MILTVDFTSGEGESGVRGSSMSTTTEGQGDDGLERPSGAGTTSLQVWGLHLAKEISYYGQNARALSSVLKTITSLIKDQ